MGLATLQAVAGEHQAIEAGNIMNAPWCNWGRVLNVEFAGLIQN
jgi:hypothetical protein